MGVVYSTPNANGLEHLIAELPENNIYLLGDYNVDLLDLKIKSKAKFEDIRVISNGYIPVVSIPTNHQSGCNKTCIDNVITHQSAEIIIVSGKISGFYLHILVYSRYLS